MATDGSKVAESTPTDFIPIDESFQGAAPARTWHTPCNVWHRPHDERLT